MEDMDILTRQPVASTWWIKLTRSPWVPLVELDETNVVGVYVSFFVQQLSTYLFGCGRDK